LRANPKDRGLKADAFQAWLAAVNLNIAMKIIIIN
jgi:hypothetical protein